MVLRQDFTHVVATFWDDSYTRTTLGQPCGLARETRQARCGDRVPARDACWLRSSFVRSIDATSPWSRRLRTRCRSAVIAFRHGIRSSASSTRLLRSRFDGRRHRLLRGHAGAESAHASDSGSGCGRTRPDDAGGRSPGRSGGETGPRSMGRFSEQRRFRGVFGALRKPFHGREEDAGAYGRLRSRRMDA